MAADQVGNIKSRNGAIRHHPLASDHHPIGAVRAAEDERGDWVVRAGKARFVEREGRMPPTCSLIFLPQDFTLTDELAMSIGVGPDCARAWKIPYTCEAAATRVRLRAEILGDKNQ